jgi:hypothetical protein
MLLYFWEKNLNHKKVRLDMTNEENKLSSKWKVKISQFSLTLIDV